MRSLCCAAGLENGLFGGSGDDHAATQTMFFGTIYKASSCMGLDFREGNAQKRNEC